MKKELIKGTEMEYIFNWTFAGGKIGRPFNVDKTFNGIFNHKQRASLMAAYALLSNQYKQYRKKAVEVYGEDANRMAT